MDGKQSGSWKGLVMILSGFALVGLGLLTAVLAPEFWWLAVPVCLVAALFLIRKGIRSAGETGETGGAWPKKDVMVGTVRSAEQLRYNLSTRSYYAPARFVSENQLPVSYIALHEQGIGVPVGIKRYARVCTTEKIPRGKIPVSMRPNTDPEEPYYYFTVEEWQKLPRPIVIQCTTRGKPRFTSKFLLEHCTHSYQLFAVRSEAEFRLVEEIQKALTDEHHTADCLMSNSRRVVIGNGCIIITDGNGRELDRIRLSAYARKPQVFFYRITRQLRQ